VEGEAEEERRGGPRKEKRRTKDAVLKKTPKK
jgi:hypothetical protein